MIFLFSVAMAKELLAPPPERVEGAGEGLSFFRRGDESEGGDPTQPAAESAYDAWWKQMEGRKERRSDVAAVDGLMRDYAPVVADCALKAGAAVGATASVTVSVPLTGLLRVGGPSGDTALAGCVVSVLHKRQTGLLLHPGRNIEPKYSFTLLGAPTAVPGPLDVEATFGGLRFGDSSEGLVDPHLTTSYRNTTHYTRGIDETVRFMGVDGLVAFDFDEDEGMYGGEVRVSGDDASFRMRENLKARFGQGKWDGELSGWYWRGERLLYVSLRVPDTTYEVLRIIDMERARRAKLVESLPGDPEAVGPASMKSLPKVLREDGSAP